MSGLHKTGVVERLVVFQHITKWAPKVVALGYVDLLGVVSSSLVGLESTIGYISDGV